MILVELTEMLDRARISVRVSNGFLADAHAERMARAGIVTVDDKMDREKWSIVGLE